MLPVGQVDVKDSRVGASSQSSVVAESQNDRSLYSCIDIRPNPLLLFLSLSK